MAQMIKYNGGFGGNGPGARKQRSVIANQDQMISLISSIFQRQSECGDNSFFRSIRDTLLFRNLSVHFRLLCICLAA